MKTIGIVGGMSWESTLTYYEKINKMIGERLGGLHSGKILLSSVDFQQLEYLQRNNNWDEAGKIILNEAKKLEKIGSDLIVICSVTGHEAVSRIEKFIKVPILHIADGVSMDLQKGNYRKVGLLGTIYTMENLYFKDRLINKENVKIIIPNIEDREIVNKIIYNELCIGNVKVESKSLYIDIINKMVGQGAEAIIFGCTEIQMLLNENDLNVPVIDVLTSHVNQIVNFALENER